MIWRGLPSVSRILGGCFTGLLAGSVGVAILLFGLRLRQEKTAFLQGAERATGVVVEIVAERQQDGDTLFYPVVEFTTAEGQTVRFKSREGRWPSGYRVGERVSLLYDRALPQNAVLEPSLGLRADLIVLALGGFFLLVGLFGLLSAALWPLRAGLLAALGLWLWRRSDTQDRRER